MPVGPGILPLRMRQDYGLLRCAISSPRTLLHSAAFAALCLNEAVPVSNLRGSKVQFVK